MIDHQQPVNENSVAQGTTFHGRLREEGGKRSSSERIVILLNHSKASVPDKTTSHRSNYKHFCKQVRIQEVIAYTISWEGHGALSITCITTAHSFRAASKFIWRPRGLNASHKLVQRSNSRASAGAGLIFLHASLIPTTAADLALRP